MASGRYNYDSHFKDVVTKAQRDEVIYPTSHCQWEVEAVESNSLAPESVLPEGAAGNGWKSPKTKLERHPVLDQFTK